MDFQDTNKGCRGVPLHAVVADSRMFDFVTVAMMAIGRPACTNSLKGISESYQQDHFSICNLLSENHSCCIACMLLLQMLPVPHAGGQRLSDSLTDSLHSLRVTLYATAYTENLSTVISGCLSSFPASSLTSTHNRVLTLSRCRAAGIIAIQLAVEPHGFECSMIFEQ
jgi:hypothetical protein